MRGKLLSRSLPVKLSLLALLSASACALESEEPSPGDGDDGATFEATGGSNTAEQTGGTTETGDPPGTGGNNLPTGGTSATGGAAPVAPVDCSGITAAGYELCDSSDTTCGAVFTDSSGCSAVCAAAGLECEAAHENLEGACGPDQALPALACDSGHQSDYCLCGGGSSAGTGGAPGTGGQTGTGGNEGTGGSPPTDGDCNTQAGPSITVSKSGGDFSTVQAAIDSLPGGNTTPTIIKIAPGEYYEKLEVNVPNITLCGQTGQTENTVLTYSDGADTSNGNGGTVGTSGSRSVNISADDVSAENLTFENTRGEGSQAVAVLISSDRVQFRNTRFLGRQDTLYVKEGTQYFRDSYIEGTVDFIFGGATAVFDNCRIHSVGGGSALTAPSTDESRPYGIVFLGGEVTSSGVSNGSVALGRNWRPYGSTTFIETALGAHISGVGWVKMGDNQLSTARFSEYQTTGPGSNPGARAPESKQLSAGEAAAHTVDNILGSWDPTFAN